MYCLIRRLMCLSIVTALSFCHGLCVAEDPWEVEINPAGIYYESDPRQMSVSYTHLTLPTIYSV